ncbi:MAG: alkane 1-monooxygenase [Crocinitomicaceae bacterium]
MKDLKYLAAYIAPVLTFVGIYFGGLSSFSAFVFAFVFIPVTELILPRALHNLTEKEVESKLSNSMFDYLLYFNVPLVWGGIVYFLIGLVNGYYTTLEMTGNLLSLGVVMGASGINVAHELGHRTNKVEQWMAQALLLPSLYMHFFVEHNLGHHKHVATPEDPSTARYNEAIYVFWVRSTWQSYINAWQLEGLKLRRDGDTFWSLRNRMFHFTIIQAAYLALVYVLAGWKGLAAMLILAVIAFLLLETINYIEHYGLLREKKPNGDYERVLPKHSWNSSHVLGRVVLYELTRHSDHHYISTKKYQILEHQEDALTLPYGYPASMLLSLVPPLWFRVMNRKLKNSGALVG